MNSYDWAEEKLEDYNQKERQRAQKEKRRFEEALDKNELRKFVATLRHRHQTELVAVAPALSNSPFARRGRKHPRMFQDLNELVEALPANDVEAFQALRWLSRLLEIEKENSTLLRWLMYG